MRILFYHSVHPDFGVFRCALLQTARPSPMSFCWRVIKDVLSFFCGAGVSRAKANLPDFFGLAETVSRNLGVSSGSPAMKIIEEAKEIGKRTGVDGLIPADRIFGLLERDFLVSDIQAAVSNALKLPASPDISAHQILVRLATTQEGLVRLVTTNFDCLFDLCSPSLPSFIPPRLPDPSRATDFHGLVYLHGKINADSNGAEGDGFVLSSSEFGKAYLSDGWATSFFKEILERYSVVFVGYSADDPPVHYLLEALNKSEGQIDGVYAFQSGDPNHASAKWKHKGVEAIAYDDVDYHAALWSTLDAWAARADNPDEWTEKLIEKAKSGPENLEPHERGQVAHVVSTIEGLRKFSDGGSPPPAAWLCVFDPSRRYAKPGNQGSYMEKGPYVDPFDFYCLDSDPVPAKINPEEYYVQREMPKGAWDAFEPNSLDRIGLQDENLSLLRGYLAKNAPRLPARLSQFGVWISKVASQPEAVWWAVRQTALHPDVQNQITWYLSKDEVDSSEVVRRAWRYLFDYWLEDRNLTHRDWYELGSEIDRNGWDEIVLRRFASYAKPYIKVNDNYWGGPVPNLNSVVCLTDLMRLDVEYPETPNNLEIPDDWINPTIAVLRRNLEVALELETELGGYGLENICPIIPDDDPDIDSYARDRGLSAWVLYFANQFQRLMAVNLGAAKTEFEIWPVDDQSMFSRLRIWASGLPKLVSAQKFDTVMEEISDEAFWNSRNTRDLLLTISKRWNELDTNIKKKIEERILQGPKRWDNEEHEHFADRRAWASLNRLHWLNQQGCDLQLDLEEATIELGKLAPEWKQEYAISAAESLEGRGGLVRTETEHSELIEAPLDGTLKKALELSGRQGRMLVEHDPFAGLAKESPVRAFAVLRSEAKKGEFPEWAWRKFLNTDQRKEDPVRFTKFIGCQLSRYSQSDLSVVIRPVIDWFQKSAKILATESPELLSVLISKFTNVLSLGTDRSNSSIIRGNKEPDWTMEAINSPTGNLAKVLFDDPQTDGLKRDEGFPRQWLQYAEDLLSLPGDLRRHAIVLFTHNLSWFFSIDPNWTKKNLLSVLVSDSKEDKQAFWSGFLWGGKARGYELFQILKPHMLRMATSEKLERRGHSEVLVGLLLSAWALVEDETQERWVSNHELRDVLIHSNDDFRSRVLWQVERFSRKDQEKWLPLLIDLLSDVWPRQIAAKSGIVSARLCDIAFSDETRFTELAAIILPLLTKIDRDHLMLPNLRKSKDNIVDLHPKETLMLLHAVLPDNAKAWPYGIDATINRIGEADNSLLTDDRLIELKRIWDSR